MTPEQFALMSNALNGAPLAALLAAALVGAVREWWVPGATHRRLLDAAEAREERWRDLALNATGLAERAVDAAAGTRATGGPRAAR